MKETLEDALIVYRREVENLIFVASPAIVLGPILVLVAASSGLLSGLVAVALLALLYAIVWSACVSAAGLLHNNEEPTMLASYVWTLRRSIDVVRAAGPAIVGLMVTLEASFAVAHFGFVDLAFGLGLVAIATGVHWASRHGLEHPMVVAFGAELDEAREFSLALAERQGMRGVALFVMVALPMVLGQLLCFGLATAISPVFGAAALAAIAALWLPYSALALTGAGVRWLDQAIAAPAQVSAWDQR